MSASNGQSLSFALRLLSNPFIVWYLGNVIQALVAGFTGPQSSLRPVGFVLLSIFAWYNVSTFPARYTTTGTIGRCICGSFACMPIIYFDRLIVRKWVYGDGQACIEESPKEKPDSKDEKPSGANENANGKVPSFGTRFKYGLDIGNSQRGMGLPWQVKNVPQFSSRDPNYVPTRYQFLARKFLTVVVCWVAHDIFIDVQLKLNRVLMFPGYVPFLARLSRVSREEVIVRVISSISYWIVQYCMIQFFYGLAAIMSVSQNPKDLKLWRPLFGSFSDAYTLREFWGNTWHQSLRATFSGPAGFIVHSVLRIPHKTLIARYMNIFFTFFLSGVMHAGSDKAASLPPEGALYFFCTQALGIMIEDGIQAIYRSVRGNRQPGHKSPTLPRIVGFIWVILFLSWSTPVWIYPVTFNTKREDALFRFNALRFLSPF